MLYFAYGSNLCVEDWNAYCDRHGLKPGRMDPVGVGRLPDHQLWFSHHSVARGGGALNVRPRRGSIVEGLLLRVDTDAFETLHQKEGHPDRYQAAPMTVLDGDHHPVQALVYVLRPKFDRGWVTPAADPLRRVIDQSTGSIASSPIDVADSDSVDQFFAAVKDQWGAVDVMINCAGINIAKRSMADMNPVDFDRVMNINATGAYRCLRAVLPSMRSRGDGLVIQVSSIAGKRALELGGVVYCASKFAMTAMGTAVSNEVRTEGVRITNVYPGEVNTPLLEQRPVAVSDEHKRSILHPEDVAAVIHTIVDLPPRAHVPEMVIKPTLQHWM